MKIEVKVPDTTSVELTVQDAAYVLNCSGANVYSLSKAGKFQLAKARISSADLEKAIIDRLLLLVEETKEKLERLQRASDDRIKAKERVK